MKVEKTIVMNLVKSALRTFAPDEVGENKAYYADDMTIVLTNENKLFGVSFESLGQSYNILNTLELILTTGEGEDDAYIVDDEDMITLINEYLQWRTKVLQSLEL